MEIDNTDKIKHSNGVLLMKAREEYSNRMKRDTSRTFRDEYGVIGYGNNSIILVAKKYIWGDTVSCHKRLLDIALKEGLGIVMYIADTNKFYSFSPKEILFNHSKNKRGGVTMVNFKIKLGINIEKPFKRRSEIKSFRQEEL